MIVGIFFSKLALTNKWVLTGVEPTTSRQHHLAMSLSDLLNGQTRLLKKERSESSADRQLQDLSK